MGITSVAAAYISLEILAYDLATVGFSVLMTYMARNLAYPLVITFRPREVGDIVSDQRHRTWRGGW